MTVTFTRTANSYGSGFSAGTPSGSGGVLVVIAAGRGSGLSPTTSGDWTSLSVSASGQEADIYGAWWALASASPNMAFTASGDGEYGLYTYRIADAASSPSVRAAIVYTNSVTTTDLPDVTTAPDGHAVGLITQQGKQTTTSTSLGWTEDYEGDIGNAGWWAQSCTAISLEGVTPGGGTFDAGTVTLAGNVNDFKAVVIVVETASGPPPATVPDAVDDLAGTAGDTQVVLTWTAPDDGGASIPITSFNIERYYNGCTC
jgi:hypothetical protein